MKVYSVYVDEYDYDDYYDVIVVAKNEERALEMIKTGYFGHCYFKESQGEIHVEEVDLTIEHIISSSSM
jgi:hypothetical protein